MPFELQLLRPLWLLALLPLGLLLWYWRRHQGQGGHWQDICDPRLLPWLLIRGGGRERRFPLLLGALAGTLAVLALAGPAWQRLEQPVFRDTSALVIALDLSRSMDSTDLAPDRLTRARLKLLDLLDQRREGQTALIAYAGQAFAVTPLTDDTKTIAALAQTLATDLMPSPGSRPDLALDKARELLRQAGVRAGQVLLITDSAEAPNLAAALARLRADGHRLHVLGVGTEDGAPIRTADSGFLKDAAGAIVIPRLDESAMKRLAAEGGGSYARLALDNRDLEQLFAALERSPLEDDSERSELQVERWREEGPWLLLLLLPLAVLAFRRGYLVLAAVLLLPPLPPPAQALDWPDPAALDWNGLWLRPDQQGARLLENQQPAEAAARFRDPRWKAAAHYRAGDYEPATEILQGSDDPEDHYNLGNALARAGRLQEALQAYDRTLAAQPDHADARYNRDLVAQALELDQPPSEQNQDGGEGEPDPQQAGEQSGQQGQQPPQPDSSSNQAQGPEQDQDREQAQQPPPEQSEPDSSQSGQDRAESTQSEPGQTEQDSAPSPAATDPPQPQPQPESGPESGQQDERRSAQGETASVAPEAAEERQATQQWLRRIPDDPGGLLRRKFQYQYRRQQPSAQETQTW